jgi:hypothetical protein
MTVCERVFRDLKFELPSTGVRRLTVSRELVENPAASLSKLIAEQARDEQVTLRQIVHEFGERFRESQGLALRFTDEAADLVVAEAQQAGRPVRELCAENSRHNSACGSSRKIPGSGFFSILRRSGRRTRR